MNRRKFITGATTLLMTPSLVRASSLEYVPRGVVLRPEFDFTADIVLTSQGNMPPAWMYVQHGQREEILEYL